MYPFNSIIAQQEYERLNDVSRDFARGRLQVRFGGRSYSHLGLVKELLPGVALNVSRDPWPNRVVPHRKNGVRLDI
jgi:hypothetical protein